jgi:M6 family metalloprotease-like protein
VAGATVTVQGTSHTVTTGTTGTYAFTGVPAGSQTIVVSRPGFLSSSASVTVPSNASLTHDVVLTSQVVLDAAASSITPTTGVAGTATNATLRYVITNNSGSTQSVMLGATLSGVQALSDPSGDAVVSVAPGTAGYTRTFALTPGAPSGIYNLSLGLWGTRSADGSFCSLFAQGTKASAFTNSGDDDLVGAVFSSADVTAPVAGASVSLQGTAFATVTDVRGVYRLTGIPAGSYTLVVTRAGFAAWSGVVTIAASGTTVQDVTLASQVSLSILGSSLSSGAGAAGSATTLTISYSITNASATATSVLLGASLSGPADVTDPGNAVFRTVTTGTQVYTRTFGVAASAPEGTYDLRLSLWGAQAGDGTLSTPLADGLKLRAFVNGPAGAAIRRPLVLLVAFADKPGQTPRTYFENMLFGSHPSGSLRDYYREVSYGQLWLAGDVNPPAFAWITLPQTAAYYAGDCYGTGGDDCDATYPRNAQRMVEDAVVAARAAGVDFGPFDLDNDGRVDDLFVVHTGPGAEATGNPGDIWSHMWATRLPVNTGSVNGLGQPISVELYSTEPEYFASPSDMTIGVFAHEFGHQLGLPDVYDTDGSSEGVGRWSLMAAGSWNGANGATPAHLDAWSKCWLGWTVPAVVSGTMNVSIGNVAGSADVFQFRDSQGCQGSSEYFLVENRFRNGFDAGLPGQGLLVWHVDDSRSHNRNEWYPGCASCTGHYHLALMQADNRWDLERNANRGDTGDPYEAPRTLTASSSPNSNLYSGAASGISITNVSVAGATMTATLGAPAAGTIQFGASSYSVTENDTTVTVSVTRVNGSSGSVSVTVSSGNGTATAGSDYTAVARTVSFADGDWAPKTVTLTILDDTSFEGSESFVVSLSAPSGGAALGSPVTATITIGDNDVEPAGTLRLGASSYTVQENGGSLSISVTRSGGSRGIVTATLSTSAGTARAGEDYTSLSQTVTFAAGDTSTKTVLILVQDDAMYEADETFTVTLASATGDASLGSPRTAAVTIVDNDAPWRRYFAEGAANWFFDCHFALANPTSTSAAVTLRFLRDDGANVSHSLTVPPLSRRTVDAKTVPGLTPANGFSTVVESNVAILADRTMTWDSGGYGSHAETALPEASQTWYLAEGATHSGFQLYYLIQNPNSIPVDVRITYMRTPPLAPVVKTYAGVAAQSRRTILVNAEDPNLASAEISGVVTSLTPDAPIIVERAMYLDTKGQFFGAGHATAGVTAPSTDWFLAEGATGYFDEFILIANPNSQPATVTITYLLTGGGTLVKSRTVAANSRQTIFVNAEQGNGVSLANTSVSASVHASLPVIVERAMWWPSGGFTATWLEAHNSPGVTATGTQWGLADGEQGGPANRDTYILVANTSGFEGQVRITLLFEDGTQAVCGQGGVAANSRTTFYMGHCAAARSRRFGAVIDSLPAAGGTAQIVVERAMYSDAAGTWWAAGTDAVATRLR